MTLEKRINDVEASVKYIAEYVKEHTDRVEKQLKEIDTSEEPLSDGLKDEVQELKRKIDIISTESHASPLRLKSYDDFERKVEGRIERIEQNLIKAHEDHRLKIESKIKPLASTSSEFSSLRADIAPRLSYIESKIRKLQEDIDSVGSVDMEEIHEKMSQIDERVDHALATKKHVEEMEKEIDELKKKMPHHTKMLEDVEFKRAKAVTEQLRKAEDYERKLKAMLEGDLSSKIKHIEEQISKFGTAEHKDTRHMEDELKRVQEELKERLSQIDLAGRADLSYQEDQIRKLKEDLEARVEERLSKLNVAEHTDTRKAEEDIRKLKHELEESLSQKFARLNVTEQKDYGKLHDALETKVKEIEVDISRLSSTREKDISRTKEDVAARLAALEGEVSKFASFEIKDLNEIRQQVHANREEIEKQLESSLSAMKLATAQRIKDIEEEIKKFADVELKSANKTREELGAKLKELDHELKKFEGRETDIAKKIKEELRSESSLLEGKVKSIEEKISKISAEEIHDYMKAVDELKELKAKLENEYIDRLSIDKRLKAVEGEVPKFEHYEKESLKRLNDMLENFKKTELDFHRKELEEIKHGLDAESARRISAEKRVHETESALNALGSKFGRLEHVEDLESLGGKLHDMERNMKMTSVRLLTQQLNEFAKAMDKRIPNVVSREEYMREIAGVHQRLKTIESPDLAPMGARVERLERKLEDIHGMMRAVYNRVPVVVE